MLEYLVLVQLLHPKGVWEYTGLVWIWDFRSCDQDITCQTDRLNPQWDSPQIQSRDGWWVDCLLNQNISNGDISRCPHHVADTRAIIYISGKIRAHLLSEFNVLSILCFLGQSSHQLSNFLFCATHNLSKSIVHMLTPSIHWTILMYKWWQVLMRQLRSPQIE